MRLPIVQFPKIVVENLGTFAPVFQTAEQQKHFCEYVTGLIVGEKATITAINQLYLNKNDQSALNKFLTQAPWDETQLNEERIGLEMRRLQQRPVSVRAGRLILDDTLAHHTHCSMDGLAYLYDHTVGHNVWAHDVVTSYYVNRQAQFPVDLRLYCQFNRKYEDPRLARLARTAHQTAALFPTRQYLTNLVSYHYRQQAFQTKIELGVQLVQHALGCQLPFSVVLFDSWFLHPPLVAAIETAQKDWIGACAKDRLVLFQNRWMQVQEYIRTIPATAYRPYQVGAHLYWGFTKVLPFKSLQRRKVRLVASYQDTLQLDKTPNFYATNRKDWEAKRILTTYCDRWPTKTFNEDVKGHLGFEDYQLRSFLGIRRHWYLSFVAYSLLSAQGPAGRSRWQVKGQFDSTGQRCRAVANELLGELVEWIAHKLQEGTAPQTILQLLLP